MTASDVESQPSIDLRGTLLVAAWELIALDTDAQLLRHALTNISIEDIVVV